MKVVVVTSYTICGMRVDLSIRVFFFLSVQYQVYSNSIRRPLLIVLV